MQYVVEILQKKKKKKKEVIRNQDLSGQNWLFLIKRVPILFYIENFVHCIPYEYFPLAENIIKHTHTHTHTHARTYNIIFI